MTIAILKTDDSAYLKYQDELLKEHEALCKRCGACCGTRDNDPCVHLRKNEQSRHFCDIYENRFGIRKTISNREINCVPIRNILHKTWLGREDCVYVK